MKLPNAGRATVEIGKLLDYSLNPAHDVGKHKARVFQAALGITRADAEWLRQRILDAVRNGEARPGRLSPFGQTYTVEVVMTRGKMSATILTSWIVENGTDFPRLTSCYVK